jgi:hypothetical protein
VEVIPDVLVAIRVVVVVVVVIFFLGLGVLFR